jgi:diguanylate cyclase (GGDEF)-like protein/PAS domain S-box-containing protein
LSPLWILGSRPRAWLGYSLVVAVLFVVAATLARQGLHDDLSDAQAAGQRQLELVGSLVGDALRRSQYQNIEPLMQDVGRADLQLADLRVVGENGAVLGVYRRSATPLRALTLSLPIEYSYRGRAVLSLTRDVTSVHEANAALRHRLLLLMLAIGGSLATALHLLLERQDQARTLQESEEKYRNILTQMDEGYYEVDLAGKLTFFNPALSRVLGWPAADMLGASHSRFHDAQTGKKVLQAFSRVYRSGEPLHDIEVDIVRKDGSRGTVTASAQLMRDKTGRPTGFRGIQRDITASKAAELLLERQALHDALTGLPNRYLLTDRLGQAILAAERAGGACALLVLDLDHFKEINDALGHSAGDALLKQIGPRLRGCVGETDTLARLGGDEFAVVLPGADEAQAERVARSIVDALVAPVRVDGVDTQINAAIGIARYPQHGQTAEELLRHADVAMYDAKRGHSGYASYLPENDPHSRERLTLIGDLHRALERDELLLYYQPKLHLHDRRLIGMEALVRWRHPTHGLILPGAFLAHAERHGEIKSLTLWVLHAAARQWAKWRSAGLEIPIAVNLSPVTLRDPQFLVHVLELLDETVAPGAWLELELTETALMENPRLILKRLGALRERGVRLSIDDFGTGYSSLAYLREFKADTLKIDQTFVHDMASNESNAMIVRAIIHLAHNLGMDVVAEGVASEEVCERLQALGCDAAQGYYLGRPMPAADCVPWMAEWLGKRELEALR